MQFRGSVHKCTQIKLYSSYIYLQSRDDINYMYHILQPQNSCNTTYPMMVINTTTTTTTATYLLHGAESFPRS